VKEQETQELELPKGSQGFSQDVSIAYDYLDQDAQVFEPNDKFSKVQ
jgi:hypothetical protein